MSLLNKGIMANLLTPIVLNFPDRGACAVDYIDYFDEGQYGPDKAFFVNRFPPRPRPYRPRLHPHREAQRLHRIGARHGRQQPPAAH